MQYTNEYIIKKKKRTEKIKNILSIFIYIIIIPIILYNIFLIIMSIIKPDETPSFLGIKTFVIISGSMEPNLNIGDIVLIKQTNEEQIKVNDIISYREGQNVITHRVIEITQEDKKKKYITKGDNNNTKDSNPIEYKNIEGKYIGKIKYIGYLVIFVKNKIVIISIILIFYLIYLQSLNSNKKKNKRRKLRNQYERNKILSKNSERNIEKDEN